MRAKVHNELSCIEFIRVGEGNWFGLAGMAPCAVRTSPRDVPTLQLNYLRRVNVLARANFAEQSFSRGSVEIQDRERGTASLISTE